MENTESDRLISNTTDYQSTRSTAAVYPEPYVQAPGQYQGYQNPSAPSASAPSAPSASAPSGPPPKKGQLASLDDFCESDLPETYTNVNWLVPTRQLHERYLPEGEPLPSGTSLFRGVEACCCCLTGIGACYLISKVVTVSNTEYAIARDWWGDSRRLDPGMHFLSCVNCNVEKFHQNQDDINLGNLHIIRISPKTIGIGVYGYPSGDPVLLEEGIHEIKSPLFKFVTHVDFSEFTTNSMGQSIPRYHYQQGPYNLVFVPTGMVALCMIEGIGHFLAHKSVHEAEDRGERGAALGAHIINAKPFILKEISALTSEYLHVGTKHRILIPDGKIGIYEENGVPNYLESGLPFFYDSNTFRYIGSFDQTEGVIEHNSLKIITVQEGHVGIIYDQGVCVAFKKGRHTFTSPTQKFAGFISTGTETFAIPQLTTFSADNVELTFNAAITIEICDAATACKYLMSTQRTSGGRAVGNNKQPFGQEYIHHNVADAARLHLASIVGHHEYNMAFKATQIIRKPNEAGGESTIPSGFNPEVASTPGGTYPTDFKGVLCAEFTQGRQLKEAESAARLKKEEVEAAQQLLSAMPEDTPKADRSVQEQKIKDLEQEMHKLEQAAERLAAQEGGGPKSFIADMFEKGIKVTKFSIEDIKINDPKTASAMSQVALLEIEKAKAKADSAAAISRAEGEAQVKMREAEGDAKAIAIMVDARVKEKIRMAEAEKEEIAIISNAMAEAGDMTSMWKQWKLIKGSGEALGSANATIMLSPSVGELSGIMAGTMGVTTAGAAIQQGKK